MTRIDSRERRDREKREQEDGEYTSAVQTEEKYAVRAEKKTNERGRGRGPTQRKKEKINSEELSRTGVRAER